MPAHLDPTSKPTPEQLVRLLIRAGWSQRDIAREVGSTQPTISRILSGKHRNPGYTLVERLRDSADRLDTFRKA